MCFQMSLPMVKSMSEIKITIPKIWARSINLSENFFPVSASIKRKIAWPPSSAGIGSMFINASTIESSPVIVQNLLHSQMPPYMVAMPIGP